MCLFTHWTLTPWGTGKGFCSPLRPQHPAEGWAGSESSVILSCSTSTRVEPQLTDTVSAPRSPQQTQLPSKSPLPTGQPQAPWSSPPLFSQTPHHHTHPRTLTRLRATTHRRPPNPAPASSASGGPCASPRGQAFGDPAVWELPHDPLQVHFTNLHTQ